MSKEIDVPKLDWFERYKRLLDVSWAALLADEDFVYRKWGKEALLEFLVQTRPQWSGTVAKRFVEKMGVKPDIEGAIKLLAIYSQELWGYGDPQYFDMRIDSPTKGAFINLVCRGWEKNPAMLKIQGRQGQAQERVIILAWSSGGLRRQKISQKYS